MKKIISAIILIQLSTSAVFAKTWSLDEITERTRTQSYASQKSFESLFRARKNVTRKIGALLPSLNLGAVTGAASSVPQFGPKFMLTQLLAPLQMVAPLLGFIYPANWFSLKESKLFFEAEKRFYVSSIANNINMMETYYLEANKSAQSIALYEAAKQILDKILADIHAQDDLNPVPFTSYAKLEILRTKIESDLNTLKQAYWSQTSEIAIALGLTDLERKEFQLAPLSKIAPDFASIDYESAKQKVLKRAVEINAGDYLLLAGKYTVKKRAWEFLSPSSDPESSLGFGYPSQIAISNSDNRTLALELSEFKDRFINQVESISMQHAAELDEIKFGENTREIVKRYHDLSLSKIETNQNKDYKEYADATTDYLQVQAELINHRYQLLAVEANYKRLIYKGKAYQNLLPSIFMKSPNQDLSRDEKKENDKIDKAIRNKELILPAAEFITDLD